MKKIATFVVLSALATLSHAACPKKLAAATYSVHSEATEYISTEGGALTIKDHRTAIFVVKIDGKGTATSSGVLTVTGFGKRASSLVGKTNPIETYTYKFDPVTCIISMDKNSSFYDEYKLVVSNSGAQINGILYNKGSQSNTPSVDVHVGYIQ